MLIFLAGLVISLATCVPVFAQMRRHPQGLHILFFAEMWERFSYYGMRALLIYYMTQHFLFSDQAATTRYGVYTSLIFLTPLIGGLLADRLLGTRKAIAFGALLLVAGHALMAVEGASGDQTLIIGEFKAPVIAEGRLENRTVFAKVGDTLCARSTPNEAQAAADCQFFVRSDGALVFANTPAGAGVPVVTPKYGYRFQTTKGEPLFVQVFFLALAFIVMGVGFLKANISSIVGQLYDKGDPRRDSGFTLYYYGINLGAFWAAVACGWLGQEVGWAYGFGAAGLGMAVGWLVFVRRRLLFFLPGPPQLPDAVGAPPEPARLNATLAPMLTAERGVYLAGLGAVLVVWGVVQAPVTLVMGPLLLGSSAAILAYIATVMVRDCSPVERGRMGLALILIAAGTVFWTLFEQAGSSLSLFAARNTALPGEGPFTITAAQTQAFNPAFILILAPIFAGLWAFLGRRNLDPNPALKFGLGLAQVGLGFLVLVWGAQFADADFRTPLIFLVILYFLHTSGEMFVSPVGLSMVTRLSIAKVVSTMMAVWFLSLSWASFLGGMIAGRTATETVGGAVLNPEAALAQSVSVFTSLGWIAVGLGAGLSVISFALKRLAYDGDSTDTRGASA